MLISYLHCSCLMQVQHSRYPSGDAPDSSSRRSCYNKRSRWHHCWSERYCRKDEMEWQDFTQWKWSFPPRENTIDWHLLLGLLFFIKEMKQRITEPYWRSLFTSTLSEKIIIMHNIFHIQLIVIKADARINMIRGLGSAWLFNPIQYKKFKVKTVIFNNFN